MKSATMGPIICLYFFFTTSFADVYLHNPRGSNNRLDEETRARKNANRLFDSQNNNRGGYNVGSLYYYSGSILSIEWTMQHSCADPNNNCNLVIQYMCHPNLRDGVRRETIPEDKTKCTNADCNTDFRYGMHENYDYYKKCKYRERNQGLFTADQKLRGKTAKYTRQNPEGTRRGYECPEERDYYPYWGASQWKDIAVLTSDISRCEYYQKESQNTKSRQECVVPQEYFDFAKTKKIPIPNTKAECDNIKWPQNDPKGKKAKWVLIPAHGIAPPECIQAPWSRDNHLGNGIGGYSHMYNWTVPDINYEHCALRIRYNISSNDYEHWNVNATYNGNGETKIDVAKLFGMDKDDAKKRGYVFKGNPVVKPLSGVLSDKFPLALAINTAQYGRVFQDRTHRFAIRKRPESLVGKRIVNLNVRGKRGNIVQVYPSVEYDFVPNGVVLSRGDYIHFQWTGSNTNNNQNDGQGRAGSDRNNVVLLKARQYQNTAGRYGQLGNNYPEHVEKTNFLGLSKEDLARLAYLEPGTFGGELSELDDAGVYFDLGPRKVTALGTFHYMCTRNNDFSNRSQKGKIIVIDFPSVMKFIGWSGGKLILPDGVQGIWIKKDTIKSATTLRIEEWNKKQGDQNLKSKGNSMNVGDSYISNFLSVEPYARLTKDGGSITVKMKVDKGKFDKAKVYHSMDGRSWSEVKDVSYSGDVASFQTQKGGIFVARGHVNSALIAGAVCAAVIGLVLIIGIAIYCKRHPDTRNRTATKFRNIKRSFQNTI